MRGRGQPADQPLVNHHDPAPAVPSLPARERHHDVPLEAIGRMSSGSIPAHLLFEFMEPLAISAKEREIETPPFVGIASTNEDKAEFASQFRS